MAQDITLRFIPPNDPDVGALCVYEAPASIGPWVQIERTTLIGTYPDWIDYYVCKLATDKTDWFAIAWEDTSGAVGVMSTAIRGGTQTLVGHVMNRVLQRDRKLDDNEVRQEAEGAIEFYFHEDPYTQDLDNLPSGQKYQILNGLTYLTMARVYLLEETRASEVQSATMGLVSFRSNAGTAKTKDIDKLIDMANRTLGINTSVVLQLEDIFDPDSASYYFANTRVVNILEP